MSKSETARKWFATIALCVLAPITIAGFSQAAFYQWSKTASSNATADPTINWAEGMSPSSVNDSARAMMARAAEYRDDISGALTTAGTSTAYTVTTNQGLPSTPTTGQLLAITMDETNGADPTLAADGGTAFNITTNGTDNVPSGTLVAGTPYTLKFSGTKWVLRDFYASPNAVPVGAYVPFSGSTAPNSNFVLAYGQCISRTTYAAYFALVGTLYGACDGTTTFGVPDLRGRVLAGKDDMGGSAASRLTNPVTGGVVGATLGAVGGVQSHTLLTAEMPSHSHTLTDPGHNHSFGFVGGGPFAPGGGGLATWQTGTTTVTTATTGITMANTGGGGAHNIVQPTIIVNYLLRII